MLVEGTKLSNPCSKIYIHQYCYLDNNHLDCNEIRYFRIHQSLSLVTFEIRDCIYLVAIPFLLTAYLLI